MLCIKGVDSFGKNEKGAVFIYAIFLIFAISVLSFPLLNITSSKKATIIQHHHQKAADYLAISIADLFLEYLNQYNRTGNKEQYLKNFLGGMKKTDDPDRVVFQKLPDGTAVTYSISYEQDATTPTIYLITVKVVAGDTDQNHRANEKFAYEKEMIYSIDISEEGRIGKPTSVDGGENIIYYGGNATINNAVVNRIRLEGLQNDLRTYINNKIRTFWNEEVTPYRAAIECTNCNLESIQAQINKSPDNPTIIHVPSLIIDSNITMTIGSNAKEVILLIDLLNINKGTVNLNINGTLIVGSMTSDTDITLNISRNFVAKESLILNSGKKGNAITVENVFYAKSFVNNVNEVYVNANTMMVENNLTLNQQFTAKVTKEILLGSLSTNTSHSQLSTEVGDVFVRDDFVMNNHLILEAKGRVAVGHNLTINNHIDLLSGGGNSVLHPNGNEDGIAPWNPKRQK